MYSVHHLKPNIMCVQSQYMQSMCDAIHHVQSEVLSKHNVCAIHVACNVGVPADRPPSTAAIRSATHIDGHADHLQHA